MFMVLMSNLFLSSIFIAEFLIYISDLYIQSVSKTANLLIQTSKKIHFNFFPSPTNKATNGFTAADFGTAVKNKWVGMNKLENKQVMIHRIENIHPQDLISESLRKFAKDNNSLDEKTIQAYTKSKYLEQRKISDYIFRQGPLFSCEVEEEKLELTIDDLIE